MILFKTGGRREVNISIFFFSSRKEDSLREREDEKEQNIFDDNEREYQDWLEGIVRSLQFKQLGT